MCHKSQFTMCQPAFLCVPRHTLLSMRKYLFFFSTMPRKVLLTAEGVVVHPPPAIAQTSQPLESIARRRSLPNHHEIKKSMQAIIHEQATQVVEAGAVLKQLKHGGGNHSTTEDKTEQKPKAKRQTRTWESRFEDLLEFKMNHGHVNVPKKWKEDPGLYWWVCSQRNKYKYLMDGHTNNLTVDQIDRLNSIGELYRILMTCYKVMWPVYPKAVLTSIVGMFFFFMRIWLLMFRISMECKML